MKKSILFGAAMAASALSWQAHAQSSVTLYGVIEDGIDFINNSGGQKLYAMRDGAYTGIYGSRWGLTGTEDLGAGLKAIFKIESGFNTPNGTLGQGGLAFGRTAIVGLSDDRMGTVTMGRQYDSVVDYVQFATTSAQWGGIATHASDIDNVGNSFRINNSVKYTSPELYGFRFGGLYGFSNSTATTSVGTTAVLSTGASYHYGALKLGAAYFYAKKPADQFADGHYVANTTGAAIGAAGPWSYVGHPDNVQTIAGAATYVIGNATLGALYSRVKFEKANGTTSNVRFDDYDVSLNYAVTPATKVGIAYLYTVGHVDYLAATPKYHRIVVGADYKLSKRTDVYAVVSAQQSAGDAKGADLYQGVAGTMSSSNRQVGVRFAIIHRF